MSLQYSRYSRLYQKLARPDVAQVFPRHVFIREPNNPSRIQTTSGNLIVKHENVLDSTLIHLSEPYNDSELYLVGTTNHSEVLANRTKRLIQELKPDVVFVQTESNWWKAAQYLQHVKSQEEMDLAKKELSETFKVTYPFNGRKFAFDIRMAFFAFYSRAFFGVPLDFNPFMPGLEVKYALEEATKLNSKIVFMGYEFDKETNSRLYHDTRFTVLKSLTRAITEFKNPAYDVELGEFKRQVNGYGIRKFLESSCDSYFVNWFIQMLDKVFPDVKRILIEMKEEDIFKTIMENKGKKMLVLVNQPHMEGIMHHWCHTYGQLPNNVRNVEIDPIGDMPLRKMLFSQMYHVIMRDVKSARFKATPASYTNDINPYWREFNFQYEHRNM